MWHDASWEKLVGPFVGSDVPWVTLANEDGVDAIVDIATLTGACLAALGPSAAGAITAALFLAEWVGDTPWAHLDIAGPMRVDKDEAWRVRGATGFGARLLAQVAASFERPSR